MTSQARIDTGPKTGLAADQPLPRDQYGALCWRLRAGRVQILLVTSRDTGRWIIPKGWPMPGRTPAEAARREAWEEAGVEGPTGEGIGSYSYAKDSHRRGTLTCAVQVFSLRVSKLERRFPERAERRRKWFDAEKAAKKVAEPDLRRLILSFAAAQTGDGDVGGPALAGD